jgi:hypothetical protein
MKDVSKAGKENVDWGHLLLCHTCLHMVLSKQGYVHHVGAAAHFK